eukprot:COSAG05_NODE_3189_length_2256_cov_91.525265_2_plen_87_part_00
MHVRARPGSQQDSCMRARGKPASSRLNLRAIQQSAGSCMHARAAVSSQQPAEFTRQPAVSRIHACERASVPDPKKIQQRVSGERFC